MKNLLLSFCVAIIASFWNSAYAQTYGFEMELTNFQQTSEVEFRFDVNLRKSPTSDLIGVENFQFELNFNPAILNGGEFINAYLTVDPSGTDFVGAVGTITDNLFVTDGVNILFASNSTGAPGSVTTVLDDTWKKVSTFIVQLSNGGSLHNFGNANPELRFRLDPTLLYTVLNRCEITGGPTTYTKFGTFAEQVNDRTLIPSDGTPLATRQLAGYYFTGNTDWNVASSWNNTLPTFHANYHQIPGANANAIIDGNAIIPAGLDVSLLPNGGNGGELTILTGQETLYTLSGTLNSTGAGGILNIWSNGVGSTNLGNPVDLAAGTTVTLQAIDFNFPPIVAWTTNPPGLGVFGNPNASTTTYTTPASNVEVIATFSSAKNSIVESTNKNNKSVASLFASLTIAPGGTLTVDKLYNDNVNGAPAIVLQSAAGLPSGSLIHNNSGVLATVERYILENQWHFSSAPISNALSGIFLDMYLQEYIEPTNTWSFIVPVDIPLPPMKGYSTWASSTLTGSKTVLYEGPLNTAAASSDVLTNSAPQVGWDPGYNLVGNPYASPIDWDAATGWTRTNIDGALYIWNGAAGQYGSYVGGSGGNGVSQYIPACQGFFVHVTNGFATGSISVGPAARVHNDQLFLKSGDAVNSNPVLKLRTYSEVTDYTDETVITFKAGATEYFDTQFDAFKLDGLEEAPGLYTVNVDGDHIAVNAMPAVSENLSLPLNFTAGVDGIYTIDASEIQNFTGATEIYLEDLQDGITVNLEETSYSFAAATTDDAARFMIHFGFNPATAIEMKALETLHIYVAGGKVVLESLNGEMLSGQVCIYNTLGSEILKVDVDNQNHAVFTLNRQGIYIVNFKNSRYQITTRKVYLH